MMHKPHIRTEGKTSALRVVMLASVCAIALATAVAMPVTLDDHGLTVKSALAGKGNGGGNGNGGGSGGNGGGSGSSDGGSGSSDGGTGGNSGKDDAPGQQKKLADDQSAAEEDAVTSIAEGESGEIIPPTTLPITEDTEPANNKVIKELAGLPEESALSEEEELEAIRSGWGTWRTADGPETVITQ